MYIHVTLGRVHAVVQGLDGHPAHRQPPLEAVKHSLVVNLKWSRKLYHYDKCQVSETWPNVMSFKVKEFLSNVRHLVDSLPNDEGPLLADNKTFVSPERHTQKQTPPSGAHHCLLYVNFLATWQAEISDLCHEVVAYQDVPGCQVPVDELVLTSRGSGGAKTYQ